METKEEILELVNQYIKNFSDEKDSTVSLTRFVDAHTGDELIDRKNFAGHITTSAFIINENANALLLLKHKSLNRWLQPGGHVDATDASLTASALREACEETGLDTQDLELLSNSIFDINSHHIPENPRKQEPFHFHHDIRYLFKCLHARPLNISLEESTDSKWILFEELDVDKDFGAVIKKIKAAPGF